MELTFLLRICNTRKFIVYCTFWYSRENFPQNRRKGCGQGSFVMIWGILVVTGRELGDLDEVPLIYSTLKKVAELITSTIKKFKIFNDANRWILSEYTVIFTKMLLFRQCRNVLSSFEIKTLIYSEIFLKTWVFFIVERSSEGKSEYLIFS